LRRSGLQGANGGRRQNREEKGRRKKSAAQGGQDYTPGVKKSGVSNQKSMKLEGKRQQISSEEGKVKEIEG